MRLTNARTTNFYYSFLVLRPEKRRAIEAVYAFARRSDDAVDREGGHESAIREIARCREDLVACYPADGRFRAEGRAPNVVQLAAAIERFKIPRRHFEDLLRGLEMDLARTRYRTFDDLAVYCYRVASTIGLISVEIFGYQNPRTRDYAVKLGQALQLVNILRDLGSDGRRGRVYLPEEDLERFGVSPDGICNGRPDGRFREMMEFEAERARECFREARRALPEEDRRAMLAAEIMAAIYWKLLERVLQRRNNPFAERVRLSRASKMISAIRVFLGLEWYPQAPGV